jgi:hypothetical protein
MKSSTSSWLVSDAFCKFLFGGYATTRKCKAFSSMALNSYKKLKYTRGYPLDYNKA